jgi:putative glutamine amidotransferase
MVALATHRGAPDRACKETFVARPVIGISTGQIVIASGGLAGAGYTGCTADYVDAVVASGGVPFQLPLCDVGAQDGIAEDQVAPLDGLILSGGSDIVPFFFGEEPHPALAETMPLRDHHEFALLAAARARHIPVLAICRGIQVLNVALGGTLYQDLPAQVAGAIKHNQSTHRTVPTHHVNVSRPSRLADILGAAITETGDRVAVTSFHHQAVKDVATGLTAVAVAEDGVIEAVEASDGSWLVGVQWHPEMSHRGDQASMDIFTAFVSACAQHP